MSAVAGTPSPIPLTRAAVAVVLSRFPKITETFILREIAEMERQGQPVVLVPLLRERAEVIHPEARAWMERALFTPFLSVPLMLENLRVAARSPVRYFGLLGRVLLGSLTSFNRFVGTLGIWPRSVWLARELERRGVRHVHAHFATHPAMAAYIISKLTGNGFSITAHAHDLFVDSGFLKEKVEAARFVRVISDFNREWLVKRLPQAAARTVTIHCGVDPEQFHSGRPAPGPPVLLMIAALEPYKGHATLLAAAHILVSEAVNFHIDLVGAGPLRAELEASIAEAGLSDRIRLLGPLPQSEVARRLADATLVVLPSVVAADGQMEGIPVVLMEALAAGTPVVASRLSGIPELIEDGVSGFLVAPGDARALALAIRRVLADPRAARVMAQRGRDRVDREFRLDGVVARLCAELDRVNLAPSWFDAAALGLGRGPVGLLRLHQRPDAFVAELVVAGRALVYKAARARAGQSAVPEVRARREHAMLERLSAVMDARYTVPRPLRLDAERGALLMDAAIGRPLDEIVRERRWSLMPARVGALENAVWRAGRWLQQFSRVTDGSAVHGDFWPGNVFVSAAAVQVIDFEGARDGEPAKDVEYFLDHLARYFPSPLFRFRRERLERVFRVAVSGASSLPAEWATCGRATLPRQDWLVRRWYARHLYAPHALRERLLPMRLVPVPKTPGVSPDGAGVADGLEDAGPLRFLHVGDYADGGRGRNLIFIFPAGATAPAVVVKRRMTASRGRSLKVEADALNALQGWLPEALRASIPRVFGYTEDADGEQLRIEALPGRSAYVEMVGSWRPEARTTRHFRMAAAWLSAFHVATRGRREQAVGGVRLRVSAAHGDFWARNLLIGPGDSARVVDFEHFREADLPLDDLFHFVVSYVLAYPWHRLGRVAPEDALLRGLGSDTAVARAVKMYFNEYCDRTGLEYRLLEPLFRLQMQSWAQGESPRGENGVLWSKLITSIDRRDLCVFSG